MTRNLIRAAVLAKSGAPRAKLVDASEIVFRYRREGDWNVLRIVLDDILPAS